MVGGAQGPPGVRGGRSAGPRWAGRSAGTITPLPAGTQNHSGQSVFSVVPVKGVMGPGGAQDFTVTFSPDHESLYFSDRLQVVLFEKVRLRETSLAPSSRPSLRCPSREARAPSWGSTPGGKSTGEETSTPALPLPEPQLLGRGCCAPCPRKSPSRSC